MSKAAPAAALCAVLLFSCNNEVNVAKITHRIRQRPVQLPEMEAPLYGQNTEAATLLPGIVAGNAAHIKPGKNARVFQFASRDSAAKMYSIAVYPRLANPNALFNGQDPAAAAAAVADWMRFAAVHTVRLDYGIGGQGSQSVYIDLKRGFKVSLPFSSLSVTVFNNWPESDPAYTDELAGIDVGASIAEGSSDNSEGLTLTARLLNHVVGERYFGVPPHAKDVTIYSDNQGGAAQTNYAPLSVVWHSIDPVVADREIVRFFIPSQGLVNMPLVFGPHRIPADLTAIGINNPNAFNINVRVIWGLNL